MKTVWAVLCRRTAGDHTGLYFVGAFSDRERAMDLARRCNIYSVFMRQLRDYPFPGPYKFDQLVGLGPDRLFYVGDSNYVYEVKMIEVQEDAAAQESGE